MARKEGLIGWKRGMTQVFADDGSQVQVTVIEAGPCTVIGIRTKDSHGYDALQLGFGAKKKNVSKPAAGLFKKANVAPMRVVREVRLEKTEKLQGYELGQALTVEMFTPAGTAATPRTARCSIGPRDPSAHRPIPRGCGRVTTCPGAWAAIGGPC